MKCSFPAILQTIKYNKNKNLITAPTQRDDYQEFMRQLVKFNTVDTQ